MPYRLAPQWLALLALLHVMPCLGFAQSQPSAVAEVRASRLAQNAAIAAHLLDSVATFWTTDVVIVSSRGRIMRGKDTYRQAFAGDSNDGGERQRRRHSRLLGGGDVWLRRAQRDELE